MANDAHMLEFTKKELIPDTSIYQTGDGTIFYHQYQVSPQKLFVKYRNKRIDSKLPHGDIGNIGVHGNALFFTANGKVYKAVFTLSSIDIEFIRNLADDEQVLAGALCTRERDGARCVYRLSDDSERVGIHVDVPNWELKGLELKGIHKCLSHSTIFFSGRAIYIGIGPRLSAHNLSHNVVVIQMPRYGEAAIFCQDNSSLIFISNGPSLYTLDIERMQFMNSLHFKDVWICSIAGVRWNIITVGGFVSSEFYMLTAQLPKQCPDETKTFQGVRTSTRRRARSDSTTAGRKPIDFESFAHDFDFHLEEETTQEEKVAMLMTGITNEISSEIKKKERRDKMDFGSVIVPRQIDNWPASKQMESDFTQGCSMKAGTLHKVIEHNEAMEWFKEREELMQSIKEYENKLASALKLIFETEKDADTMREQISELEHQLIENSIWALHSATSRSLQFHDLEKLKKPFICFQFENGTIMYFDNAKPFELFCIVEETRIVGDMKLLASVHFLPMCLNCFSESEKRVNADLSFLEGEYDCSFKGTVGNHAYFSAVRRRSVKFFKASIVKDKIELEKVNELTTSDLILFENEPMYYIEEAREWVVYHYHNNYEEMEGERFDISCIRSISKYQRHYHRGILYFFRESSTAKLQKINEKVVLVEGPILDGTLSFYTPHQSDCVYIANSSENVILTLNTANLNIAQQNYDPPIDSTYHSIVGIHNGMLTMAFEGKGVGRCLMTTKLF